MEKLTSYLDSKPRGFRGRFADQLGISASLLSNIAAGRKGISPEMAKRIADATDGELTPADLLPDLAAIFAPRAAE